MRGHRIFQHRGALSRRGYPPSGGRCGSLAFVSSSVALIRHSLGGAGFESRQSPKHKARTRRASCRWRSYSVQLVAAREAEPGQGDAEKRESGGFRDGGTAGVGLVAPGVQNRRRHENSVFRLIRELADYC
jgi:hypothetical protein